VSQHYTFPVDGRTIKITFPYFIEKKMDCLLRSTPHKDSVVFFLSSSVWPSIAHLLSLSFIILLIFLSAKVPKPCRCSEHDQMYGGDTMTLPLRWTRLTYGSPSLISDKSRMRTWWRTGNLRKAALYSVWPRRSSTKHFHRAILSLKPEIHYSAHKS